MGKVPSLEFAKGAKGAKGTDAAIAPQPANDEIQPM